MINKHCPQMLRNFKFNTHGDEIVLTWITVLTTYMKSDQDLLRLNTYLRKTAMCKDVAVMSVS